MVVWIARCMAAKWKNAVDTVENVKLTFFESNNATEMGGFIFSHAHAGVTPLQKKTSGSISLEGAFICWRRILECIALIEKHWKHFQLTPRLNQMTIQTPLKRLIQWV